MATKKKMLQAAAGNAGGGAGLNVEEVFSTYLYDGGSTTLNIDLGIDLAAEDGLTWIKSRNATEDHFLFSSLQNGSGQTLFLETNTTGAAGAINNVSQTSTGFSIPGGDGQTNQTGNTYASWTFRKAPKFFDIVQWSGNSTAGRTISHNLGTAPGMIIVKGTNVSGDQWSVYHRSLDSNGHAAENNYLFLNSTQQIDRNSNFWNNTAPTSTNFTVGAGTFVNTTGHDYVAYLFAHNDGDGEFGPDGDADIIKCGSLTTDGSGYATADLGFEPQFVLVKSSTRSENWHLLDTMRGLGANGLSPKRIKAESSDSEDTLGADYFIVDATSLKINAWMTNHTYIYIAIRRGTKVPESATEVFEASLGDSTVPGYDAPFAVDMAFNRYKVSTAGNNIYSRLTGPETLNTSSTAAASSDSSGAWDYMDGWYGGGRSSDFISWMWKRAPGYFDAVAYTGDSNAGRTVSHNLTVAPEMMWVKNRNGASGGARPWIVYHKDTGNTGYLKLNETSALITSDPQSKFGNGTVGVSPTASDFTVAGDYEVNYSGDTYIAYLFASLPGISKVGSYTGNGSTQNIDCGFTSGARFVLIKCSSDGLSDWHVMDSTRGIVAGNDPFLYLNNTTAEDTGEDMIDPYSSGFALAANNRVNTSGRTYIFYAIA